MLKRTTEVCNTSGTACPVQPPWEHSSPGAPPPHREPSWSIGSSVPVSSSLGDCVQCRAGCAACPPASRASPGETTRLRVGSVGLKRHNCENSILLKILTPRKILLNVTLQNQLQGNEKWPASNFYLKIFIVNAHFYEEWWLRGSKHQTTSTVLRITFFPPKTWVLQ